MSDPTRLAEAPGDDATALERELLRAGKEERLAGRDRREIWAALATQLVPPVAPGGPVAAKVAAGAKAIGMGAGLKGTLVAIAVGAGLVGYGALSRHPSPPVEAPRAPAVIAPAVAPEPPLVIEPPSRPRSHRPSLSSPPASPPSRLAAEGRVVLEARADLRDGRPDDALRLLEAARAEFADGALAQEREALAIEALARTGRRADARRRAEAFSLAYPESPHAAAVKGFASP